MSTMISRSREDNEMREAILHAAMNIYESKRDGSEIDESDWDRLWDACAELPYNWRYDR